MIKKLTVIALFLTIASGCSTSWKNSKTPRIPASTIADYEIATDQTTVQTLRVLNAGLATNRLQNINADIDRRLGQILRYTSVGYKRMQKFDDELNAAVAAGKELDLATNKTYLELQKVKELLSDLEARMGSVYVHLWRLGLGVGPMPEKISSNRIPNVRLNAFKTLDHIHSKLGEFATDARILGIVHLRANMSDVLDSLEGQISTTGTTEFELAAKQSYGGMVNLINTVDGQQSIIATMNPIDFTNVVNSDEALEKILIKSTNERTPQAAFINKNGRDFPANTWTLTFDDGPNKTHTRAIAKVLRDNGIKGEYFWLSNLVKGNAGLAKEIYDQGHGVSSHSKDHADLTKKNGAALTDEVSGSKKVITDALVAQGASDYKMVHFRCPYGACVAPKSAKVQDAIVTAGLIHVYWTVDTLDWQDKNTASVLERTLKQMKASGRGIILFHDIHGVAENVVPLLVKNKYVTDNKVKWSRL